MILDHDLFFTVTSGVVTPAPVTSAGSQTCANVIDLGQGGDALGGNELAFHVVGNGATITGSGAATVKASWETCPDSGFAASNTKEIAVTPAVPIAPNGGLMYRMKIMDGVERFNRVKLTTAIASGTTVASAGVNVFLTKEQ